MDFTLGKWSILPIRPSFNKYLYTNGLHSTKLSINNTQHERPYGLILIAKMNYQLNQLHNESV